MVMTKMLTFEMEKYEIVKKEDLDQEHPVGIFPSVLKCQRDERAQSPSSRTLLYAKPEGKFQVDQGALSPVSHSNASSAGLAIIMSAMVATSVLFAVRRLRGHDGIAVGAAEGASVPLPSDSDAPFA